MGVPGIARQAIGRCTLLAWMENTINSDKDRDLLMRCWAYLAHLVTSHLFCTSQELPPLQAAPPCSYPSLLLIFSLHGGKDGEKEQEDLSSEKATLSVAADNLQSYISCANIGTIFPSAPAPPASEFSHFTHPPA